MIQKTSLTPLCYLLLDRSRLAAELVRPFFRYGGADLRKARFFR
jgi:hypothetical protein